MPDMFGPDIDLMPDEKMVLASNPHWFYFWKQVAAGIGLLLLLLLLWTVDTDAGVITVSKEEDGERVGGASYGVSQDSVLTGCRENDGDADKNTRDLPQGCLEDWLHWLLLS